MQTILHPAFEAKILVPAALLERSRIVRNEARTKVGKGSLRYQDFSHSAAWNVIEIATEVVQGRLQSGRHAVCRSDGGRRRKLLKGFNE
ncbi:hypothetical protein DFS21_11215 [Pseudomonas sp. 2848]|uniref:hypothetical protein n=1 Tax=Pseudomonas sp. 2848 TaxID=2183926 RepID=UPI000DB7EFF1|nr:hypothetical protein DFS21_11215 [Pseudomonas sp. 2848]